MIDRTRLVNAYRTARAELLGERVAQGHWVGELSSSALSTATAVSALSVVAQHTADPGRREMCQALAARGIAWLLQQQNDDGGFGDTDKSSSNIATTMLVEAAFHLASAAADHPQLLARARQFIEAQGNIAGLRRRYGRDKTFAVPILANRALAGLVPWQEVTPLPFELACAPAGLWRFLRLPVVSYAIPALVAVGQARFFHSKPSNPATRTVRRLAVSKSLKKLDRMQPASGGFLEATPLTSFVAMCLGASGQADHLVVRRAVRFLAESVRSDGSWPIDTNLATWTTTLAINALAAATGNVGALACLDWLLGCQHRWWHPLTNSPPGGWGWSDLSGAVPDADDTAGALLALRALRNSAAESQHAAIDRAAKEGVAWLLRLQNADGGWPTFCRGWGRLPFDRSGADLSAHALRALHAWRDEFAGRRVESAIRRGLGYLAKQQRDDGSWVPLWFGNQDRPNEENPVYGTTRVLLAYRDLEQIDGRPAQRGLDWLASNRLSDGSWGPPPNRSGPSAGRSSGSVEETALATEALLADCMSPSRMAAWEGGLLWLVEAVERQRHRETAPIGLYFARLWYYERLYPLTFTVSVLGQAVAVLARAELNTAPSTPGQRNPGSIEPAG